MDIVSKTINNIKDIFGSKNEIVTSVSLAAEERFSSTFYGYFIFSWLIINWRLVYIAFFVGGDNILSSKNILRNEYLFFNIPTVGSLTYFLQFFVYPFVATIFIFWVFPYITRIFFAKNIRNQIELKIIELKETKREKVAEKDLVKEEADLLEKEIQKSLQVKKAIEETPELLWEKEYEQFKKLPIFSKIDQLRKILYENNGKTHRAGVSIGQWFRNIDSDIVAYCDSRELITLTGKTSSDERIELTSKGKYFMAKYLSSE